MTQLLQRFVICVENELFSPEVFVKKTYIPHTAAAASRRKGE
jgi:hypothetical protein